MPLIKFRPHADQRINYFLEEFPGASYNNRLWSVRGTGGSLSLISDAIGGQARLRASSNRYYEIYQSITAYSAASKTFFSTFIRPSSTASIALSFGLNAKTPNNTTSYVAWVFDTSVGSTWRVTSVIGGSATTVDTGITADTTLHDFRIVVDSGSAQFFIDTVHTTTITTNIPTLQLSPFVLNTSRTSATKDAFIDWIEAWNERE